MIPLRALGLLPIIVPVLIVLVMPLVLRLGRSRHPLLRLCKPASVLLGISLFVGLMVAVAGGALYPPTWKVAAPLACDGTVDFASQSYSYKPGQAGVSRRAACIGPDGRREDITGTLIVASTLVYGGIVFLLVAPPRLHRRLRDYRANPPAEAPAPKDPVALAARFYRRLGPPPRIETVDGDPEALDRQLRHLGRLHEQHLITDTEYTRKKAELLARL